MVEYVCKKILLGQKKSLRRTGQETQIPPTAVWRIQRKSLTMKPYKLLLVKAITADDKRKRKQFCVDMQEKLEEDKFMKHLVFSDEATFHMNGKVNKHNVRIWGEENPNATVEHVMDSPKVSVFCTISKEQVDGPFFFEANVTGDIYLHMHQNWLMDEPTSNEQEDFILQQDGAPPHWKLTVQTYLNENLRGRWIGRVGDGDNLLSKWLLCSPEMTPGNCFLGELCEGTGVYPPLPANLEEHKQRITTVLQTATQDMLQHV